MKVIDNPSSYEMPKTVAENYLKAIQFGSTQGDIIWTDCTSKNSELDTYYCCSDKLEVYGYMCVDYESDKASLYIENFDGQYYTFNEEYQNDLATLFGSLITECVTNENDNYIDAEYEEVNDEPFEFIMDVNYNYQILGK